MKTDLTNRARGMLAAACCVAAGTTSAAPQPHFTPSAFAGYLYDSNVFRVPGSAALADLNGASGKADSITTYGAGLDMRLPVSRQTFDLRLEAARNEYHRYTFLDHTAIDGRGRWAWEYGKLWSGELRMRYREDIASFEEFRQAEKDERTLAEVFASAYRRLDLRWDAGLAIARREIDHGLEQRRNLDREMTVVGADLTYTGMRDRSSAAGVHAEYRTVRFPNRAAVAANASGDSHQEYELAATLTWDATARSAVSGKLGLAMADHDFPERDFTGLVGFARYHYLISAHTGIGIAAWRDLNTRTDTDASYVVDAGVSIEPHWDIGPATTLGGILSYTRRDYEGDPALDVSDIPTRRDRLTAAGITLAWTWRETFATSLDWRWESRDSNREEREYRYQQIAGQIRLSF